MGIELRRGDYQHPVDSGKTGLCSHARRGSHRTLEQRRIDSRKGAKDGVMFYFFAPLRENFPSVSNHFGGVLQRRDKPPRRNCPVNQDPVSKTVGAF